MYISLFKNTIIFLTSFYLADKINKSSRNSMIIYMKYIIFSFALSLIMFFFKIYCPYFCYLIPELCFFTIFSIKEKTWSNAIFCITLSSYIINILTFHIVSFLFCAILTFIFDNAALANAPIIIIVICAIYPLLIMYTLKSTRIYNGISYIIFNGMISYNTFACFISLIALTLEQLSSYGHFRLRLLRVITVLLCLILILYWLRSQITKTYREKLRLLELKTLRTAKAENEAYITKLEAENKRLGTIIHKDNRIVNAMADSVCDYLSSSANSSTTDLQAKGQSLSDEINSIKTYRQELLCQGSQSGSSIHQTNQAGVDAIISFMVKEAASYGITMKFHFDGEFFTAKHFTATEMDFVHLLSDLLENAIIATRHANGKAIELSLQILKGTPAISVSDSGIPFEIETFMKLGTCEASTHTDEGGTGIGLMDIWAFKKKYHASLVIEELGNSTYSKRLSILFDNRNKYLIISNRFQQIISNQTRSDLLVINSSTNDLSELIEE